MTNATIIQRRAHQPASDEGVRQFAAPQTIRLRCVMDIPTQKQRNELTVRIAESEAVLYLKKSAARSIVIDKGDEITVTVDLGQPHALEVVYVRDRQKSGGLAHFECFLKAV